MASRAEIRENLPDTLPADFGEWDASDSSAASRLETRASETRAAISANKSQRELAPSDVSLELETGFNVTPFPELEEAPIVPRGIPAPAVRAPRSSPLSSSSRSPVKNDSPFLRRLRSIDTVVDKLPTVQSRIDEIAIPAAPATVTLVERKPDIPIFSRSAMEAEETGAGSGPKLLNEIVEEEEERRATRKWIVSGCVFGSALLLVAFQIFHSGSTGQLKQIMAETKVAATSFSSDTGSDTFTDSKPSAMHPLQVGEARDREQQKAGGAITSAEEPESAPGRVQTEMMQTQLMAPTRLPENAKSIPSSDTPPPASLGGASMAALNGGTTLSNVFTGRQDARVSGPKAVSVSAGVAAGMLIRKTQPVYPSIARSARVQGTVVLQATISRAGSVINLKVVSGPPMLRQAAIDAVMTWQYRPYLLNNEPTEVDTTVNVLFSLGG